MDRSERSVSPSERSEEARKSKSIVSRWLLEVLRGSSELATQRESRKGEPKRLSMVLLKGLDLLYNIIYNII